MLSAPPALPAHLESAISALDPAVVSHDRRRELLARSHELASGRERPGRYWKIDIDALDLSALDPVPAAPPAISAPSCPGLVACDLSTAAVKHPQLLQRALRARTVTSTKFSTLATALCNTGAFVYVPADAGIEEPIEIAYHAQGAIFPATIVLLERGASATVIERLTGQAGAFVCGIVELVVEENARLCYAAAQTLATDRTTAIFTRAAFPAAGAAIECANAELGASLSIIDIEVPLDSAGAQADVATLFFPNGEQHVDIHSTVRHHAGGSQSRTIVKSAAAGRGQARYVGDIQIAAHAQSTQASLRDDALLLSRHAHIDSVPALEIAANDVKAFHGATVGAIDEEQIFYMTSRGLSREEAERMIALGFFEPVVDRFPTERLRAELRSALEEKVQA